MKSKVIVQYQAEGQAHVSNPKYKSKTREKNLNQETAQNTDRV